MNELNTFRAWLDPYLINFIEKEFEHFTNLHQIPDIENYTHHIKRLVEGGKRVRPFLCALAYESETQSKENIIDALIGIEIFHLFCLVHDDIIDQSSLRRGNESLHHFIQKNLPDTHLSQERQKQISEGQAMLLGDFLFSLSIQLLFAINNQAVKKEVQSMMHEVIAGQMIDVQTTLQKTASKEIIERKMYYKTASYTFVHPFNIGLLMREENDQDIKKASKFTKSLGIAFQIQDDYLDIMGDPKKTGKPILSDIQEGQHTVFSQAILENSDKTLREEFMALFGYSDASEEELKQLQKKLQQSDILENGLKKAKKYFQQSRDELQRSTLSQEQKDKISQFISAIESRQS